MRNKKRTSLPQKGAPHPALSPKERGGHFLAGK